MFNADVQCAAGPQRPTVIPKSPRRPPQVTCRDSAVAADLFFATPGYIPLAIIRFARLLERHRGSCEHFGGLHTRAKIRPTVWTARRDGATEIARRLIFTAVVPLPASEVFLALFLGKLLKYGCYGWLAAKFPSWYQRLAPCD